MDAITTATGADDDDDYDAETDKDSVDGTRTITTATVDSISQPPKDSKDHQKQPSEKRAKIDFSEISKWLDPRVTDMMGKLTSTDAPFNCKLCKSKEWRSVSGLLKHIKKCHPEQPVAEVTHPYLCDVCNSAFSQIRHVKVHAGIHETVKRFKCNVADCTVAFVSELRLRHHIKYQHNPKRCMCTICGKCFSMLCKLKQHDAQVHQKLRPHKCEQCGKMFGEKKKRDEHERSVHNKVKPYVCVTCEKTFSHKHSLDRHALIHTGEKPCKCQFCDYRCPDPSYLRSHLRKHTGVQPYQCQFCGQKFAHHSAMKRHERKHTGEQPFQCKYCAMKFTDRTSLVYHEKKKHVEESVSAVTTNETLSSSTPISQQVTCEELVVSAANVPTIAKDETCKATDELVNSIVDVDVNFAHFTSLQ